MKPIQTKHELQFDYFSENYHQFEMDFYKWAATSTPLVFLEDDILHSMAAGQRNYFRLHHTKSRDHRDHYFYFKISTLSQSPPDPYLRLYRTSLTKDRSSSDREKG